MKAIAFRAWYVGFRAFLGSAVRRDWSRLPLDGALGFVVYFDKLTAGGIHYRETMTGSDWYWRFRNTYHHSGDSHAKRDEWQSQPELAGDYIRGMWTTDAEMRRVAAAMMRATEPPS